MKTTFTVCVLLTAYCFLSVLIQQREITRVEKRIVDQADLLEQIHKRDQDIMSQDRRIRDLSSAVEEWKKAAKDSEHVASRPAPIGITPGQGTVRPPCIVPGLGLESSTFNGIPKCGETGNVNTKDR